MGHQSQESSNLETKVTETLPVEREIIKPTHPFLEKNDITLLSIVNPLLSPIAQRLVSFFIHFATPEASYSPYNLDYSNPYTNKPKNPTGELLSSLVGLLTNQDSKNSFNPAMLTTLLSMINNKNEE